MGRGGKKEEKTVAPNPEAEERMAFSKSILSENSSRVGPSSALAPSKIVTKHHGKDILRSRSGRTDFFSRFWAFSVRFLVGNLASSKTLARHPILYLDFPQV
ncbi:DNA-binding protein RHL1 [Forsythia ovata]|uniref:DNA-binding protein RHL1 n=1 Tax=Forsythia ovata TaxID=205694 RepID=A0ABD1X022_9LAMI